MLYDIWYKVKYGVKCYQSLLILAKEVCYDALFMVYLESGISLMFGEKSYYYVFAVQKPVD